MRDIDQVKGLVHDAKFASWKGAGRRIVLANDILSRCQGVRRRREIRRLLCEALRSLLTEDRRRPRSRRTVRLLEKAEGLLAKTSEE